MDLLGAGGEQPLWNIVNAVILVSPTRDGTLALCIGSMGPNHGTSREIPTLVDFEGVNSPMISSSYQSLKAEWERALSVIHSKGWTSPLRIPSSSNSKLIHASRLLYQHFWHFSLLKCLLPDLPTSGF